MPQRMFYSTILSNHRSLLNCVDSSKRMEAMMATSIAIDLCWNTKAYINAIVINDDASVHGNLSLNSQEYPNRLENKAAFLSRDDKHKMFERIASFHLMQCLHLRNRLIWTTEWSFWWSIVFSLLQQFNKEQDRNYARWLWMPKT